MRKFDYAIISVSVILLIFLYLISSTDLILTEQTNKIYKISVIMDDENDICLSNYKIGIEQALKEWTADINIVYLYERNNVEQQMDLILREIQNGTDAIIVLPADTEGLRKLLDENPVPVPVICVKSSTGSEKEMAYIHVDDYKRGVEFAEKIIESMPDRKSKIYAFTDNIKEKNTAEFYEGFEKACEENKVMISLYEYQGETDLSFKVNLLASKSGNIMLALDEHTLNLFITKFKEETERAFTLYGSGYNNRILHYLNKKAIKAISIGNDFDMGYLSIKTAIMVLKGNRVNKEIFVDSYTVKSDEVYHDFYEKILYPIY